MGLSLALLAWSTQGQGNTSILSEAGSRNYLRLAAEEVALETSVVQFEARDGGVTTRVDLISAVHIADRPYYQELNRRFAEYEVVLYELVAPKESQIPSGEMQSTGFVSMLQGGMKDVLGLSHQLEEIDYTAPNFVHADLTPKQFLKSMSVRGESFTSMFLSAWMMAMSRPQANMRSEVEMIAALLSDDRPRAFKLVMARQFDDADYFMSVLEGGEQGSTLITARNKMALAVLREQLSLGRTNIAIFYGAGHMADFAARLQTDFSMAPVRQDWVEAWNLRPSGTRAGNSDGEKKDTDAQE